MSTSNNYRWLMGYQNKLNSFQLQSLRSQKLTLSLGMEFLFFYTFWNIKILYYLSKRLSIQNRIFHLSEIFLIELIKIYLLRISARLENVIIFHNNQLYKNKMSKNVYMTPHLKFYKTSASVFKPKENHYRTRTQGFSSVGDKSEKNLAYLSKQEDQYVDLTVESIKKKYNMGNLKPFAVNNYLYKSVKKQVEELKQSPLNQPLLQNFYNHQKLSIDGKLNRLLNIALQKKRKNRKQRKKLHLKELIQTQLEDDHENLRADYQQQMKNQKLLRQKTFIQINNQILEKYSPHVDTDISANQRKTQLFKFKKQRKVVKKYSLNNQELLKQERSSFSQNALEIQKQDYGIYSRSVNRALYFKQDKKYIREKQSKSVTSQSKSVSSSNLKIDKKFYLGYMSSYTQRRNVLRNSIGE